MKLLQKISSLFIGFTILSATNPSIAQANRAAVIQACGNLSYGQQEACLKSGINDPFVIQACGNLSYGQQVACLSSSHNKQPDNRELLQNRGRKKWMYFSLDSDSNVRNVGFLEMFDNSGFFYVTLGDGRTATQQMTLKTTQRGGIVLEGKVIASDSRSYVPDKLYLNNLLEQNMFGENCDGVHDCVDFKLVYLGNDT